VRFRRCPDPFVARQVVSQIAPEYDADVVKFEPLRGVDASDLRDPVWISGPNIRLWNSLREFRGFWLGVPGSTKFADLNVINKGSVGSGHRPRPTEAGRKASAVPFGGLSHYQVV
jgi:hypothetical protein